MNALHAVLERFLGRKQNLREDSKNQNFILILLRININGKIAGWLGFYRVIFGQNRIRIKITFLELGSIVHYTVFDLPR